MSSRLKDIPVFQSEEEEREFWRTHDTADYIDLSRLKPAVFPNLRPTTRTISIRLPETLLSEIKMLANKRDVPYQSLMKIFLAEKVQETLKKS
jgi:predicted DNA binding CopG/RHH family protein